MEKQAWLEEIMVRAKYSPVYQTKLEVVKRLESAFLELRDSLPEQQRKVLEDYLSACEELDHELLRTAVCLFRKN